MDRNSLSVAEEDDFLEAVRSSIRAEGRSRVLDAIFSQGEVVDSQADDESDGSSNYTQNSDESVFSDDTDDVNSVDDNIEKVDYIKLHDPIVHDHVHCPPFQDMSSTFCGVPCGICDCEDFCFAMCFQENNFQFFKDCFYSIDFDEQFTLAAEDIDNLHRRPNNEMRKYQYKKKKSRLILV